MTQFAGATKYVSSAVKRRENFNWQHLFILLLLLVPKFVSTSPTFVDTNSFSQVRGDNTFIFVSSITWLTYAIIGNFDSGTEKVICFTNEAVLASGGAALVQEVDDSLREIEWKWFNVLSRSTSSPIVRKEDRSRGKTVEDIMQDGKKWNPENFVPFALKGALDSQLAPNFLKDLHGNLVPVSLKAFSTEKGDSFVNWCVDTYNKKEAPQIGQEEATFAANETPAKGDKKEYENTANRKKKTKQRSRVTVLLLHNLLLAKEVAKRTSAKFAEESTKTFIRGSIYIAKETTVKFIDKGTKQTLEKVTQNVAVGSVYKIVQKGTEQTVSGIAFKAGVVTGEKIVKEGAKITAQTSQVTAMEITKFGMKKQITQKSAEALTSVSTLGTLAQRAKDGVKGTLAASALVESGILATKLCWSYGQLKFGEIGEEEFREQVVSDVSSTGGSMAGTAIGAAIGSMFLPGIGTAVGSLVGGIVGSHYGSKAGEAMLQN